PERHGNQEMTRLSDSESPNRVPFSGSYKRLDSCQPRKKGQPVHRPDRFIASCACWSDFWQRTKMLPIKGEKGAAFERLTQLYLQTAPEYQSELKHIWTLPEVPSAVRKRLALPLLDEGIDLIAQTRHGKYWAIQSKF